MALAYAACHRLHASEDAMTVMMLASGRELHYADHGAGPPLLLLSGTGSSKEGWNDAVEWLAPRFRCLMIDNRDAGESEPELQPYTIAEMADDAAACLR